MSYIHVLVHHQVQAVGYQYSCRVPVQATACSPYKLQATSTAVHATGTGCRVKGRGWRVIHTSERVAGYKYRLQGEGWMQSTPETDVRRSTL